MKSHEETTLERSETKLSLLSKVQRDPDDTYFLNKFKDGHTK